MKKFRLDPRRKFRLDPSFERSGPHERGDAGSAPPSPVPLNGDRSGWWRLGRRHQLPRDVCKSAPDNTRLDLTRPGPGGP